MADFSYSPKFHHLAIVDNVDRVEGAGPKGFNLRFETIESDLHGVSTVVTQIGAELDQLTAKVAGPPTVTVSVAPALQPVANSGAWALQTSGIAVAPPTGGANGVVPLTPPDHVRMTSLRVRGHGVPPNGQNTTFFLSRVSVSDGKTDTIVAFDTSTVPLNTPQPLPNSALSVVDLANFRYVISASTGAATADPVTLVAFQLACTNA